MITKPESTRRRSRRPSRQVRRRHSSGWEADSANHSLAGRLLVATPSMGDPRFAQAVIYICAHTPEGAMGLVLNRPLSEPRFADLLLQLDIPPDPSRDIRVCSGGPVDQMRGFVLHSSDWRAPDTLTIDHAYSMTASLDILRAIADGRGPARSILALGYAGWESGQLEAELRTPSWLAAPADEAILFDSAFDTKWRRALGRIGIDPAALVAESGHA